MYTYPDTITKSIYTAIPVLLVHYYFLESKKDRGKGALHMDYATALICVLHWPRIPSVTFGKSKVAGVTSNLELRVHSVIVMYVNLTLQPRYVGMAVSQLANACW